ncbi:MAG: hypothetical protein WC606_02190 [Candidatus Absconditabacterales bacterium]
MKKALIIADFTTEFVNILNSLNVSADYITNMEEAKEKLAKNIYDIIILQDAISPFHSARFSDRISTERFYNTISEFYSQKIVLITNRRELHETVCAPYGRCCYNIGMISTSHPVDKAIKEIVEMKGIKPSISPVSGLF